MKLMRLALVALVVVASATTLATGPASAETPSPSPSPSPGPGPPPPYLEASPLRVTSGGAVDVIVRQGGIEGHVDLYAANRVDRVYRVIRSGTMGTGGAAFRVYPDQHKSLYAVSDSGANRGHSNFVDISVTAAVSITADRTAARTYTFAGVVRPVVTGAVVSLFRRDPASGRAILTAQGRTSDNGSYRISRYFTGSGRFQFFTSTAGTDAYDAGTSSFRSTLIY